jgi:1,4-dihydroxy-2-naphthoate octaprenyltransferase
MTQPTPPTVSETPAPTLSLALLLRMTRPGFLLVTLVGCVLGMATAAACGCGFDEVKGGLTVLLALMAHAGANVLNDACDADSGADAANTQALSPWTGGARLIQQGRVTLAQTRQWAWTLLALSAMGGLWLAVQSSGALLAMGAAGLVLAWAYSAPPLRLMHRGLGEVVVALAWWGVVVGADLVQRERFFLIPAVAAVSFALLVANILLVAGLPDARSDAAVGKRTLAVRLGPHGVAVMSTSVVLLAYVWLGVTVWAQIPPAAAIWGLWSLPLSAAGVWLLWRHRLAPQRLAWVMALNVAAAVVHGLAMAAGVLQVTLV